MSATGFELLDLLLHSRGPLFLLCVGGGRGWLGGRLPQMALEPALDFALALAITEVARCDLPLKFLHVMIFDSMM